MFCIDDVNPSIFITLSALAFAAAWTAAAIAAFEAIMAEADDEEDDFELLRDLSLLLLPLPDEELELDLDEDFIELPELGSEPDELDF